MTLSWDEQPFGDLFLEPSRNGLMAPSKVRGSGVRLVNMREAFAFDVIGDQEMELAPLPEKNREVWLLQHGDLLFARQSLVRSGAGKCCFVQGSAHERTFESHLIRVRLNPEVALPAFYYYLFRSETGRRLMSTIVEQVAAAGIRATDLRMLPVPVPPLSEQRRIVGVLDALDRLIATNLVLSNQMDELVRVLGRQYLAQRSGADRAPLSELTSITKGLSYRSAQLVPGDALLVNLKNVGRNGEFQARGFKDLSASPKPQQYVECGDILVAQTDLTQDRAIVGRPVRVRPGRVTKKLVASLDLVIVRPGETITPEYLFAVLDSDEFRAHALANCNGTTVVHMASRTIPSFQAPVPDQSSMVAFSSCVRALRSAADDAVLSSEQVRETLDQLLPLLLSGRVSVRLSPDEVAA